MPSFSRQAKSQVTWTQPSKSSRYTRRPAPLSSRTHPLSSLSYHKSHQETFLLSIAIFFLFLLLIYSKYKKKEKSETQKITPNFCSWARWSRRYWLPDLLKHEYNTSRAGVVRAGGGAARLARARRRHPCFHALLRCRPG